MKNRDRKKVGTSGINKKLYAVYLEETDVLLAFGTANECSKLMDLNNTVAFYELCSKVKRGKNKKYVIVVMDDTEEEDGKEEHFSEGN